MSDIRSQYLRALHVGQCVIGPTGDQIRTICPHLTDSQIEKTLMRGVVVAVPPSCPSDDPFLAHLYDGRILCVYSRGANHFSRPPFWEEAVQFAKLNWPDSIVG